MEVRWAMSGQVAAVVSIGPNTSLDDFKAQMWSLTSVPVCDQRLYADGDELRGTELSPSVRKANLTILRVIDDPRHTDLSHFHVPLTFDAVPRGSFTKRKTLARGIHGDVVACKWMTDGTEETVAVKRVSLSSLERSQTSTVFCERDIHMGIQGQAPDAEDALTEIGIMAYLGKQGDLPVHLLQARAIFADSSCMWLVSEFADGGELFNVAASKLPLEETQIKQYMWQLLFATEYLHRHCIGHRDISLENVLLKDGSVRLMDFGTAVRSHSASGKAFRYFRATGKDFYRAPECYVPAIEKVKVTPRTGDCAGDVAMLKVGRSHLCEVRLPAGAQPHKACTADVWGYAATPADVLAVGMCMFILGFQNPAWNQAIRVDHLFSFFFKSGDDGVQNLVRMWQKRPLSPLAMSLLSSMLCPDPARRATAAQSMSSAWFAEYRDTAVATHSKEMHLPTCSDAVKRRRTSGESSQVLDSLAQCRQTAPAGDHSSPDSKLP